ncbi:uncharacterized protein LOC116673392 isoform X2 [Etheostoma spectabile]|uniref:uncharacterized protein LOC116673392 isoform X2 n=1 Tax=Etheostoma spectabile TaxID=54343 RepID=UPI0013AEE443|nr:uncharacterized protein LOC116673392 isoform X2 [Etheostoma spectabile]
MTADRWIFLLALWFICVSSNEQNSDDCKTHTLSAALGSSVLLPCYFTTIQLDWVSWAHTLKGDLVHIKSEGRIRFLDHRNGRVKVFPNQGSKGNYSIFIDKLNNSDMGCYHCKQGYDCLQVELVAERDALSEKMRLLIFICAGVAALILLSVSGYGCIKCKLCCNNRKQYNTNNPEDAGTEGVSATPVETGGVPVELQQRGAGNDHLVYENDDQGPSKQQGDPNQNYCSPTSEVLPDPQGTQPIQSASGIYPNLNQFERMESQRKKQGFHQELFSRLRQASLSRHYYVNQSEINQQQAMPTQVKNHRKGLGKKKAKEKAECKNPIYNRSTDQLNHL